MNSEDKYEALLLRNQLCFPFYAATRKIISAYTPLLKEINLTYPQYITMMVLWETNTLSMHDLCKYLYLDSGTLTPLLKKLESMGLICRKRSTEDERVLLVSITEAGLKLRDKALTVPEGMICRVNRNGELFGKEEAEKLKKQLYRIIEVLDSTS